MPGTGQTRTNVAPEARPARFDRLPEARQRVVLKEAYTVLSKAS